MLISKLLKKIHTVIFGEIIITLLLSELKIINLCEHL